MLRKLKKSDYKKGFINLLFNETKTPQISYKEFKRIYKKSNAYHLVYELNKRIIGYGYLIIDYKFRNINVGNIENIIISKEYHNNRVGYTILDALIKYSRTNGCYKVILNCDIGLMEYYRKIGFNYDNVSMCKKLI